MQGDMMTSKEQKQIIHNVMFNLDIKKINEYEEKLILEAVKETIDEINIKLVNCEFKPSSNKKWMEFVGFCWKLKGAER
jgi:hypothetical protein